MDKYEEALERAKELHEAGNALTKAQMEIVFPELKESEDERIRKLLVWQVHRNIEDETNDLAGSVYDGIKGHDPDLEESIEDWKKCLAYLEKQKDASKAIEAVERIDKYIDEHVVNAHDMQDSNPDKKYYHGWDDALGKMAGILQDVYSIEKQKERKYDERDFTIYHPLKNGKGEYECIPYSFFGSLTSFSEDKDLIYFLRNCFYTEEECNEWIEQQKEQNQSCNNLDDEIQRFFDECIEVRDAKIYGVDERVITVDCYELTARHFAQWQKEQMPVEWSEEDEKTICEAIDYLERYAKEYVQGGNSKQYIFGIASRLDHLRPHPHPKQEWSEKDEAFLKVAIAICNRYSHKDIADWLKSLRPQPRWKPSEEQMEWLESAVKLSTDKPHIHGIIISLYEQLKRL